MICVCPWYKELCSGRRLKNVKDTERSRRRHSSIIAFLWSIRLKLFLSSTISSFVLSFVAMAGAVSFFFAALLGVFMCMS